jgi:hypothetical protein
MNVPGLRTRSAVKYRDVPLSKEQLLAEIEDAIRTMPSLSTIRDNSMENLAWFGRASAAIENWKPAKSPWVNLYRGEITSSSMQTAYGGIQQLTILLNQARHDLLVEMPGAGSAVVPRGMVFDYFDEIRKKIELAKHDVFFIDPYLDAEFVTRYLPIVARGVTIRLLAREKLGTLLPAVDTFTAQYGRPIEVRSAPGFHDRYLLVDKTSCYQSGASFKDGAKSAPTTITQILDAFPAVSKTYEDLWTLARVER